MESIILGLGTSLPPYSVSQANTVTHATAYCCTNNKQAKIAERLVRLTKIEQRASAFEELSKPDHANAKIYQPITVSENGPTTGQRMQHYTQSAAALAESSSRKALECAGVESSSITHLITVSCTGFQAPGFDLALVESLPLRRDVQRTHIGFMGCHGLLNGLRVADALAAKADALVLVCATELCSLHLQYGWDLQHLIGNALFADGSAAVVVGNNASAANNIGFPTIRYKDCESYVVPHSEQAICWNIGDHGFEMTLSSEVPALISEHLPEFIGAWLKRNGLKKSDIRGWAIHPGGPRILDAVQAALELADREMQASRQVLTAHGNMSSPTVLFILKQLLTTPNKLPCVMLGFGPGLTIEAALLQS